MKLLKLFFVLIFFTPVETFAEDNKSLSSNNGDVKFTSDNIEVDEKNKIVILPTICPHEGSPLRETDCSMKCNWHGRKIIPYISFEKGESLKNSKFVHLNRTFVFSCNYQTGKAVCEIELQK